MPVGLISGTSGGRPGTASGRWCNAVCPRCRPSSRGPGRSPRPSPDRPDRSAVGAVGSATGRRAGGARRGPGCAWEAARAPSARGLSTGRSPHDCGTSAAGWLGFRQTPAVSADDAVMLRATGLGRRFGELWAIRHMDLEVHRGEVLGLLGPNGAGKTTTVRLLAALIEPTEGRRRSTASTSSRQPDAVRARVGILTETPGPVREAVGDRQPRLLRPALRARRGRRATERIERYLRLFSLWERRDDVAGGFSKGMKQKLAIARALLHEPVGRLPRRADRGPRSRGGVHRARGDRGDPAVGPDDRPRHPQPVRGRPAVRPGRVRARWPAAGRFAGRPARFARRPRRRGRVRGRARAPAWSTAARQVGGIEHGPSSSTTGWSWARPTREPSRRPWSGRSSRPAGHRRGARAGHQPRADLLRGDGRPARGRRGGVMRTAA